jgi:uncharacterized protein YqgC (DUF456 family)
MLTTIYHWITQYAALPFTITAVVATIAGVLGGWVLTLMGMPGNWLILVLAIVYDFLLAPDGRMELGWPVLFILALLAVGGEIVEFATGAIGVAKTGGSRRSAMTALVGSFVGGIGGAMVGLPIPVAGPVLGVLLFASLGALVGAVAGEYSVRKELKGSLKVGVAAFLGRIFGSVGKTLVGGVMVVVYLVCLLI